MMSEKNHSWSKTFFFLKTLILLFLWQIGGCAQNENSANSSQKPDQTAKESNKSGIDNREMKMIPPDPGPGETIRFHYILGYYKNTCVPQFETEVDIKQSTVNCVTAPCPQHYTVEIQYEIVDRPDEDPDVMCGQAMTQYGPKFTLYDVKPGDYSIKHNNRKIFGFSIQQESGRVD